MLWLSQQFWSHLSKICGMNFLLSVYSLWLFYNIIPFLQLSYFPIDQWFTNLTWYQSLFQASIKSCLISIVHQKHLSFHINPGMICLLPLNCFREFYPGVTHSKKVYMSRWKCLKLTWLQIDFCFVVVFVGTYVATWRIDCFSI